jgi:hypothetical protein
MINHSKLKFETNCGYLGAGSSKCGKSYLFRYIICEGILDGKYSSGIVFTTTKFNADYTQFLPTYMVIEGFNMDMIDAMLEAIKVKYKDVFEKCEKEGKSPPKGAIDGTFIVLDDILSLINQHDPRFQSFLATYRHYNISLFCTTQYIYMATPLLRQQMDYAFMFNHDQMRSLESLYETFGTRFETLDNFRRMLKEETEVPYTAVLYLKDAPPQEKYFQYRAPANYQITKFTFDPKEKEKETREPKQGIRARTRLAVDVRNGDVGLKII